MIYAAFTVWLFGILFVGIGVHRLWTRMIPPLWVNWALLPGTVVSEMAYIFGCLITGGEIRRARLLDSPGGGSRRNARTDSEPTTEATQRFKVLGPIVASLFAILACAAAILVAHWLLGKPVIRQFITGGGFMSAAALPDRLPTAWDAFWGQIETQVRLLKRMSETCRDLRWLDWRVPLFVYLSACFAVRLAPVKRDLRATLTAVVAVAIVIAVVGLISKRFTGLMRELWPLLTYVWTSLLLILAISLILMGVVALVRVLSGKSCG